MNLTQKPVVIVGELLPQERAAVLKFLFTLNAPVYAEALSGLRGHRKLAQLELRSSDKILSRSGFDGVIRIGGVPTTSFWRQLEEKYQQLPVMSFTRSANAGLVRKSEHVQGNLQELLKINSPQDVVTLHSDYREVFAQDQRQYEKLRQLFKQFPRSEPGLLFQLQNFIAANDSLYLGNSLPIREWDLISESSPQHIFANRGMNGIDGQLSTFFGCAEASEAAWGIFGDLTTLYDLSAGWLAQKRPDLKFRLVVINNGGGKIFSRMFGKAAYENQHQLQFADWAKMWSFSYQSWQEIPAQPELAQQQVIELQPDAEQTEKFWQAYDESWRK